MAQFIRPHITLVNPFAMANPNGENGGNSCAHSQIYWDENGFCVDNTLLLADDISEKYIMPVLI